MDLADAEEYTQALGQVVSGGWRQIALGGRLGVPEALGLSTRDWVEERLGGYVRMSIPERREAVAELAEEGLSTRDIADTLGVSHETVARDQRAERESVTDVTPEPEPEPESQVEEPTEHESVTDVTPEPEPAISEAINDVMDGALDPGEAERQKLSRTAARLFAAYHEGLLALEAEAVASVVDPEMRIAWRQTAEQSARWWDELTESWAAGLRVVEGGR